MNSEERRQALLGLGEEHPAAVALREELADMVDEAVRATGNPASVAAGLTDYYAGMQEATVAMRDHFAALLDARVDPEDEVAAGGAPMRRPGGAR